MYDVDDTYLSDSVVAPPAATPVDVVWLPVEVVVGVPPVDVLRDEESLVVVAGVELLLVGAAAELDEDDWAADEEDAEDTDDADDAEEAEEEDEEEDELAVLMVNALEAPRVVVPS